MKDIECGEFFDINNACADGREWAYGLTEKRGKAMMSEEYFALTLLT